MPKTRFSTQRTAQSSKTLTTCLMNVTPETGTNFLRSSKNESQVATTKNYIMTTALWQSHRDTGYLGVGSWTLCGAVNPRPSRPLGAKIWDYYAQKPEESAKAFTRAMHGFTSGIAQAVRILKRCRQAMRRGGPMMYRPPVRPAGSFPNDEARRHRISAERR